MEDNRKRVRIDKQTKSITVVKGNKYFCAINVNQDFMDRALVEDNISSLEHLFEHSDEYRQNN